MGTATISETRCKVSGFGYANRTWAKRGVTLRFDDAGIADVAAVDVETLDLEHHPEFNVEDVYTGTFDVRCDSPDELELRQGQSLAMFVADPVEDPEADPVESETVEVDPSAAVAGQGTDPSEDPSGDEDPIDPVGV